MYRPLSVQPQHSNTRNTRMEWKFRAERDKSLNRDKATRVEIDGDGRARVGTNDDSAVR